MNYSKKIVTRLASKMLVLLVCALLALPAQAATLEDVKAALQTLQSDLTMYQSNRTAGMVLGTTTGSWWKPAVYTTWQWQLTGTIDQSVDAQMFDIDLFDTSAATIASLKSKGKIVICYFSAGSYEDWRPDASQFPASVLGRSNGWAGEKWLDIRNLTALGPVMEARLDLAVSKGCHGVEPDNIDGYTNSTGFPLTGADQITYNKWLAEKAHARNLSIGLKNDVDQVVALEPYFDWALNEQCFQYNECDTLLPFIKAGKPVFTTEYSLETSSFCTKANQIQFMSMKKKLDLDASRQVCWTTSVPTPTPTPTPTPLPTVSLSLSPASIMAGGVVTVTWSSQNATSCTASGSWSGTKALSGSESLLMSSAGIMPFTLSCTGAGGTNSVTTNYTVATVTVTPTPTPTSTPVLVKMSTTDTVNVRKAPGGRKIGTQPQGAVGYKLSQPVWANKYNWINIDFITGVDGYVAEPYLVVVPDATVQAQINDLLIQIQDLELLIAQLQYM